MKRFHRSDALANRTGLSWAEVTKKSNLIRTRLSSIEEYQKSRSIMFYVSKDNEVFTHDMIREAFETKAVLVPKVMSTRQKGMQAQKIDDINELSPGHFGVLEPGTSDNAYAKQEIDLVIVPIVAFDDSCNRIGYGHGYYDIFLRDCDCYKIGLAFEMQKLDSVPANSKDVKLDIIITEDRIIKP